MIHKDYTDIEDVINRINEMEIIFDRLQDNTEYKDEIWYKDLLNYLITYYQSDLWKYDYQMDELGLLPSDLKRGILSEDGIYNFITSIESE